MSLADDCHRLANTHYTLRDGTPTRVPSLLAQLNLAITAGIRSGAAGSGEALPISSGALSLLQDIDREAREIQAGTPGAPIQAPLADIIRRWPHQKAAAPDERPAKAKAWAQAIEALLHPQKPPRRLRLPCPACHVLYTPEGENALRLHCWTPEETMAPMGDWTAECVSCGAVWKDDGVAHLIHLLEKEPEHTR